MAGTKSRLFSLVVTILMIVSAIIIGGVKYVGNLRYELEQSDDLNYQFEARVVQAENLVLSGLEGTTMDFRSDIDMDLIDNVQECANTLSYTYDIAEKMKINDELTEYTKSLNNHLKTINLESDKEILRQQSIKHLDDINKFINSSSYPERLREYNRTINRFPINIMDQLLSIGGDFFYHETIYENVIYENF